MKIFSKRYRQWAVGLALIVLTAACTPVGNTGSGEVLVRVYDKYLYTSDLKGIIPSGLSVRDSLTMVRTFIQNWVDKELVVKKAEENLPHELKDFSDRIDSYRNSLIIYEYEKMLLKQELDTMINFDAVTNYYEQYKSNFVLKKDMLLINYLVLHADSPHMRDFRQFIQSDEPSDRDSLALYCSKYSSEFSLLEDAWLDMDDMLEIVPISEYTYNDYLANRRYFEVEDSIFTYMVRFLDYKPADSIAPVQAVEKEIKEIILNTRKKSLIKNMRQTVLQDAVENNQVEIY